MCGEGEAPATAAAAPVSKAGRQSCALTLTMSAKNCSNDFVAAAVFGAQHKGTRRGEERRGGEVRGEREEDRTGEGGRGGERRGEERKGEERRGEEEGDG